MTFLDIDGDAISVVGSDGDSNETLQINVFNHFDVECIGVGSTVWRVTGTVSSDTVSEFAD